MLQEQMTTALTTPRTADKSTGPSPAAPRDCGKPPGLGPIPCVPTGAAPYLPVDRRTNGRCAPLPAPLSPAPLLSPCLPSPGLHEYCRNVAASPFRRSQ